MKKTRIFLLTIMMALGLSLPAQAEFGDVGLSAKVGTLGPGMDLTIGVLDHLNLRVTGAYLPKIKMGSFSASGIDFDAHVEFGSVGLLADWHPLGSPFRISAGAIFNNNEFTVDASPSSSRYYTVGDHRYSGSDLGSIEGDVKYSAVAPYVGVGYGNALDKNGHWSLALDLGVIFQISPDVNVSSNNPHNIDWLNRDVRSLEDDIQDEADKYKFYPVLMVGISYRF